MWIVADVLRPYWLQGVANVSGVTTTPLKGWLTGGNFVFQSYNSITDEFTFYTPDHQSLLCAFAFDINKLSSASFESIYGVRTSVEIPRSSAWALIRSYYAALFAAHAIGRVFGESATSLERDQSAVLNTAIRLNGGATQIRDGLHMISCNGWGTFNVRNLTRGGRHEDTWIHFDGLLNRLSTQALKDSAHFDTRSRQETYDFLQALIDILRTRPCGARANWLSYVRNAVNYNHQHGTWFPHSGSSRFRKKVFDTLKKWKNSPSIISSPDQHILTRFTVGCAAIVAMNREIIQDMADRNHDGNSFLSHGAARVLSQTR